jgi:type II secretory pathway component PulJ
VTRLRSENGTSLMEVMIASAILVTLMAGLMSMMGIAIKTTENQGHLAARTTEYAQDKMEQLLALAFTDAVTDTRTFPATASGGSGLAIGGSIDVNSPVALYVDYLDENGNLLTSSGTTAPSAWFYKRVWKIEYVSGSTTLKKINVATTTSRGFGGAMTPTAYLTVLKTFPF